MEHPLELVSLVRGSSGIDDRNIQVQCNEKDGKAYWAIRYRSSASMPAAFRDWSVGSL